MGVVLLERVILFSVSYCDYSQYVQHVSEFKVQRLHVAVSMLANTPTQTTVRASPRSAAPCAASPRAQRVSPPCAASPLDAVFLPFLFPLRFFPFYSLLAFLPLSFSFHVFRFDV